MDSIVDNYFVVLERMGEDIEEVSVATDPNIFKNAMGVIIPSSGGECGAPLAAAMGAVARDPLRKLQVFADLDATRLAMAKRLLDRGKVKVVIERDKPGLYVRVQVKAGGRAAEAVISGQHDNIVSLALDGKPQTGHPLLDQEDGERTDFADIQSWLASQSLEELVDLLDDLDKEDLAYVEEGLELNLKLAEYGLAHGPGMAVGRTQLSLIRQGLLQKDMALWAGVLASAGVDSRMGGAPLPAMTLAGSGNQGIAAGVPIAAVTQFAMVEDPQLVLKAVTLSYLVTCYVKNCVGRLSALCGSGVAGGAGVAAGVTYLLGGTVDKIGGAIKNHIETFAVVVCDGAKTSCALKVGEAASSAVKIALLALQGAIVRPTDGIIDHSPEQSMRNLGIVVSEGTRCMDPAILKIMLDKER